MKEAQVQPKVVSVILLAAGVSLGWFAWQQPGVPRITGERLSIDIPADEQDVVARLWEDPLQSVQAELARGDRQSTNVDAAGGVPHSVEALAKAVEKRAATSNRICLLVVPIPESPFPDDAETRLRLRYSVQMALAAENFAPENRNALGYINLDSARFSGPPKETAPSRQRHIAYEWFVPRTNAATNSCAALVLWLPEVLLSSSPLTFLQDLQEALRPGQGQDRCQREYPYVFVVGPRSSDTLKVMVPTDLKSAKPRDSLRNHFSIFSPEATTPDALIGLEPTKTWALARQDFESKLCQTITGITNAPGQRVGWRYFHNCISPDDQLTDLLVTELKLRGLDLNPKSNEKILLLAEADTQYGRSLPLAFRASLESCRSNNIHCSTNYLYSQSTTGQLIQQFGERPIDGGQLVIHRYLRGLDQQKGHTEDSKAPARLAQNIRSPEDALAQLFTRQAAMPLGESQLDYVDRLAEKLRRSLSVGRVRAVGVLGGDLYDKLILLRSLRSRFPGAVFFTTDLDARMWHPDHLPFTRNLVVASSYGVNAIDAGVAPEQSVDEQRIPPFRDCYQVAVFHACRGALRKALRPAADIPLPLHPAIFELGRNGPDELNLLTDEGSQCFSKSLRQSLIVALTPYLPNVTFKRSVGLCLLVAGLLLVAVVLSACRSSIGWTPWLKQNRFIVIWTCFCLLDLYWFFRASRYFATLPGGEPWGVNQGTSIWPTEIMRLLILTCTVATFVWAWRHFVQARTGLIDRYYLDSSELLEPEVPAPVGVPIPILFRQYVEKAKWWQRMRRVTIATVAYMLLAFGMVLLIDGELPPRPHIRGDIARSWDMGLLMVSVVSFLGLVFYVLDAVLITAQLLSRISDQNGAWPDRLVQKETSSLPVNREELEAYLDVRFAAEKSQETGKLILIPFAIQVMFILSRSSYFDDWSWPGSIIVVFLCNLLLACTGWFFLRRCVKQIRGKSLELIDKSLAAATLGTSTSPDSKLRVQQAALIRLRKLIKDETRGGYAPLLQDPALCAVVLPSGMFGIFVVLVRVLFEGV